MEPRIVLQPHLGRVYDNYKPGDDIGGYIALGKVIKVHRKTNTADVQLIKYNDVISSSTVNEGKFAARIGVPSAAFDRTLMSSSGVIEPIAEGQLVAVAFMHNTKSEPIILCSFHDTSDTTTNILPNLYLGGTSDGKEDLKYLRVFPSQVFYRVDGDGGIEFGLPSGSFLKIDGDFNGNISDAHGGFDHEDLEEKDPITFETRSGRTEEAVRPLKMLFSHRSSFNAEETPITWTKFFLDTTGLFRITRDNNDDSLTYMQLSETGGFKVRRQLDSDQQGQGSNTSEISMEDDGSMAITRVVNGIQVEIKIDADGVLKASNGNTGITINGASMTLSGSVNVIGALTLNGRPVATSGGGVS